MTSLMHEESFLNVRRFCVVRRSPPDWNALLHERSSPALVTLPLHETNLFAASLLCMSAPPMCAAALRCTTLSFPCTCASSVCLYLSTTSAPTMHACIFPLYLSLKCMSSYFFHICIFNACLLSWCLTLESVPVSFLHVYTQCVLVYVPCIYPTGACLQHSFESVSSVHALIFPRCMWTYSPAALLFVYSQTLLII